jgi:hypothetical protein
MIRVSTSPGGALVWHLTPSIRLSVLSQPTMIKSLLPAGALAVSVLAVPVHADDQQFDAALGGALGGGFGALVGNELGGRNGAIVGGALGAAAGAAVTVEDQRDHDRGRYRYGGRGGRDGFCPPGQAKKGRC